MKSNSVKNIKVSGGMNESGLIVGNVYDKYNSRNPFVRKIMGDFEDALNFFVKKTDSKSIHEIGSGEGFWVIKWCKMGFNARGSDFSHQIISLAGLNAINEGFSSEIFSVRDIYQLEYEIDKADLIVCSEVLEHLEYPELALSSIKKIVDNYLILSVPREPIWSLLNILRGKYFRSYGNTPGHIQKWSRNEFVNLVGKYFNILDILTPLPWTMILCNKKNAK